jgi:hypothetical protein
MVDPASLLTTRALAEPKGRSDMKKIARSKRNPKAKSVESEIRRAAARAQLAIEPWPGEPDPGKAMLTALRQAEWRGDHAALLRRFALSYSIEAAKLDGKSLTDGTLRIPTILDPDGPSAVALAFLKDKIVAATDLMSEALASLGNDEDDEALDTTFFLGNLREAHRALWRIRWECYASAGAVVMKSENDAAAEVVSS